MSIIIPALNEEHHLAHSIERAALASPHEIIVVDGGSADATTAVATSAGARVIHSQPGRGRQMNAGAVIATGDTLLFLHADTLVPSGFAVHIQSTLCRPGVIAGAFRLRIDSERRSMRMIERVVNWRSRFLQLPYGDQAIFIRAATFQEFGGFPDIPVMEDFALIRRLKRAGRIALADTAVATSARRWLQRGVWRTTMTNQLCIAAYLCGVPACRIAAWRDRAPPVHGEIAGPPAAAEHSG